MINLNELKKLSEIKKILNEANDETPLEFGTDSRTFKEQSAFVALKGDTFDGFKFADQIVDSRNLITIVFEGSEENIKKAQKLAETYPKICFIAATDIIQLLQIIGKAISKKFYEKSGKAICISGSNGKTTTKEMIYFLLKSLGFHTIKTISNNNNHIGVPLTLFQINLQTEYAVVELGSNHPGEIPTLCRIIDPHIGFTTNIGMTHLEFFETLENVAKEESYLYEAIKRSNKGPKLFFVNNDDEYLKNISGPECVDLNKGEIQIGPELNCARLKIGGRLYEITNPNLIGKHNFFNIGAASVIVHKITGKDIKEIILHAKNFQSSNNRSQWVDTKFSSKVFLDAYNANPSSMREAIGAFFESTASKCKQEDALYIVGDMNELGKNSEDYHKKLGEFISELKLKNVWFVGRFTQSYQKGFSAGMAFASSSEAKLALEKLGNRFKYIFIKGSRSLQLESILDIT